LGKALERIIATKLAALAELYKLLLQYQIGTRYQKSTLTALELFTEQIYTVWNCRNQYIASLLNFDIAEAFNNTLYTWLIYILKQLQVPNWIVQ
jgi:hypothetical protein